MQIMIDQQGKAVWHTQNPLQTLSLNPQLVHCSPGFNPQQAGQPVATLYIRNEAVCANHGFRLAKPADYAYKVKEQPPEYELHYWDMTMGETEATAKVLATFLGINAWVKQELANQGIQLVTCHRLEAIAA